MKVASNVIPFEATFMDFPKIKSQITSTSALTSTMQVTPENYTEPIKGIVTFEIAATND